MPNQVREAGMTTILVTISLPVRSDVIINFLGGSREVSQFGSDCCEQGIFCLFWRFKMKNIMLRLFGVLFALLVLGCASTSNSGITPDKDHAVVTVKRNSAYSGFLVGFNILIDNQKAGSVASGGETKLLVKNGNHSIYIGVQGMRSPVLTFTANSNQLEFTTYLTAGLLVNTLHLVQTTGNSSQLASDSSGSSRRSSPEGANSGIEAAVNRACETLIYEIPKRATVAILSVSSRDRNLATFVVDEVEFQLVDSKEFQMVDRKTLDSIRDEQQFQMSGEVSDSSAISIGNMLGASIVITGTISGSDNTQRLTLKALDVKTAKIVCMARESF
jgi:TolB-like protein